MAIFAQPMPEGVVAMHWKLSHSASGKFTTPSPAPIEATSRSRLRRRSGVYEVLLCAVIFAGPASEIVHSRPLLPPLSRPAAAILHQTASSIEFNVQDMTGPAGIPLPIKIETGESEKNTGGRLFIFTGIPKGVKLDPGGDLGAFWAVNSNAFDRLTLLAPENFHGSFEVAITQTGTSPDDPRRKLTFLVTITVPDEANTELLNAVAPPADGKNDLINVQPPANLQNLRDKNLMERAYLLFGNGDISAARSIFEYLVARGNAEAAIAMGGTYDPLTLRQLFVKGMMPDPEQARSWYQKAEELGSAEARSRLTALAER
jgi:hypothetical protein